MPKNKFQDVIFTIIMATIMVYGMVVYNVALNTGGVSGETFLAALSPIADYGTNRICFRIFRRWENCKDIGIYCYAPE